MGGRRGQYMNITEIYYTHKKVKQRHGLNDPYVNGIN
jgi:hypothetical protein